LFVWLTRNPLFKEAGEVYRAWLGSKQPLAPIMRNALSWMAKYKFHEEAGPLYMVWLDTDGPIELIESFVSPWLQRHQKTEMGQAVTAALRRRSHA